MLRRIPKSFRLMMCMVGQARPHEQGFRQAVQVVQASFLDRTLAVECHKSAFGPAIDGACQMQVGPSDRPTRKNEVPQGPSRDAMRFIHSSSRSTSSSRTNDTPDGCSNGRPKLSSAPQLKSLFGTRFTDCINSVGRPKAAFSSSSFPRSPVLGLSLGSCMPSLSCVRPLSPDFV